MCLTTSCFATKRRSGEGDERIRNAVNSYLKSFQCDRLCSTGNCFLLSHVQIDAIFLMFLLLSRDCFHHFFIFLVLRQWFFNGRSFFMNFQATEIRNDNLWHNISSGRPRRHKLSWGRFVLLCQNFSSIILRLNWFTNVHSYVRNSRICQRKDLKFLMVLQIFHPKKITKNLRPGNAGFTNM